MVEIVEEVPIPIRPVPIIGQQRHHNIVSGEYAAGEDDDEDIFSTDDNDEEDEEEGRAYLNSTGSKRNDKDNDHDPADLLYDENLDDEDEAYVYKNMRGGIRENVTVLTGKATTTTKSGSRVATTTAAAAAAAAAAAIEDNPAADGGNGQHQGERRRQSVQVYKPRSSDAVLSCPCCFNIVCMDCQKHKRYPNQYRAMFVMGVVVDWNNILVYDDTHRVLVPKVVYQEEEGDDEEQGEHHEQNQQQQHSTSSFEGAEVERSLQLDESQTTSIKQKQNSNHNNFLRAKCGEYYSVECSTCRTQVAALDMTDEVYHFHGCLESSSSF